MNRYFCDRRFFFFIITTLLFFFFCFLWTVLGCDKTIFISTPLDNTYARKSRLKIFGDEECHDGFQLHVWFELGEWKSRCWIHFSCINGFLYHFYRSRARHTLDVARSAKWNETDSQKNEIFFSSSSEMSVPINWDSLEELLNLWSN